MDDTQGEEQLAGREGRAAATGEPLSKKLRCSDPDLKIIVKYTNDNDEEAEKEYQMHSITMATLSQFVDTALSVEMRENSTKEITMHVESPEVFEKALRFQQNMTAARSMTTQDAVDLVEFYDKYSFSGGLELCDGILSEFFDKNKEMTPDKLDLMVDAAAKAFQFNLPKAKHVGIDFIKERFMYESSIYGRVMFSVEHIRKLHPIFKGGEFESACEGVTEEERDSPLFPKWFVEKSSNLFGSTLQQDLPIIVSGTQTDVDGIYKYVPSYESFEQMGRTIDKTWNGQDVEFFIDNADGGWNIKWTQNGIDRFVLWKCPYYGNLTVPPEGPWIAVDNVAKKKGTPKISYRSDDDE